MKAGLAFCVVAAIAISGCAGGASVAPSVTAVASTAATVGTTASNPSGVVAIGHSGLTGEGTGGTFEAVLANSWATGTSPEVKSVWLRLKAVRPDLAGDAVNLAHGGAYAAELPGMALESLKVAPTPALVTISTIDNDIRCDGTDAAHIVELGADVRKTLETVTIASPETRILVVGQLGRPSISFVENLIAHDPEVTPSLTGTGMCDFLDPDGAPNVAHFKTLTGIIDAYEAEEARICASVAQCRTDGGVRKAYVDVLENFSPDWAHLNVKGQAAEAELIWPVVEGLLGL